ncbi:ABC transporter substrate-binding protein [Paenibacillus sp. HN-1]|uniref:ABC transporter substrate-binding protein n=1 Tax=Paenibacillus TaxID=44249 RepID=UPI001CA8C8EB|nr:MULTISPECIES: ABC transporter substrate-binding protein [Paenibacillus]MBY9082346.1 ABC transporter substrate-binding protein [Paenibacillus sp. CGMCC 1.18879]MBY9086290.1 ABC transporter substrate-binding protein [Paenibacillus sinensis]
MNSGTAEIQEQLPRHLLAMLPCPLKVPLEETFVRQQNDGLWSDLDPQEVAFEGNANQSDFYTTVDGFESEEELPDAVITPGISSFFHQSFRTRFLDHDVFADAADYAPNARFAEIGMKDPLGRVTLLCVNPLVIVADKARLGGLPEPRSWSDLLNPEYRKQVTMRGHKGSFCETVLLTLGQCFGQEILTGLGRSVRQGLHPGQMAKLAGTDSADATALYVMPYFYANNIRKKEKVSIIWPEEGAIASPVFLLAKRQSTEAGRRLADFFTGAETAQLYEDAFFPSPHPSVKTSVPDRKLLWMGWDLVWNRDIQKLTDESNAAFLRGYKQEG